MVRAVLVDPYVKEVTEVQSDLSSLLSLVGKNTDETWMVPHMIENHIGFVDTYGLTDGKPIWQFNGMHVWGSMLILSKGEKPAKVSLGQVKSLVKFI